MTTHSNRLNSFTLKFGQGRTAEPLDILGQEVLVKLTNADTNGATAIFHLTVPRLSGPPLHRHSREDEWFYVLDGEITVEVDGQCYIASAGSSAFAPRGTAHAFQNFREEAAHLLVMVTPAGVDKFFEEVTELNKGLSQ